MDTRKNGPFPVQGRDRCQSARQALHLHLPPAGGCLSLDHRRAVPARGPKLLHDHTALARRRRESADGPRRPGQRLAVYGGSAINSRGTRSALRPGGGSRPGRKDWHSSTAAQIAVPHAGERDPQHLAALAAQLCHQSLAWDARIRHPFPLPLPLPWTAPTPNTAAPPSTPPSRPSPTKHRAACTTPTPVSRWHCRNAQPSMR
ncbi:RNaseH domain-containing protein [Streptomyces inhibens]|uniref:RNaseH domain-containing protein n=1 Tax=Streptomyces inhibens TaxID=2293571 RepID=UPI00402AA159